MYGQQALPLQALPSISAHEVREKKEAQLAAGKVVHCPLLSIAVYPQSENWIIAIYLWSLRPENSCGQKCDQVDRLSYVFSLSDPVLHRAPEDEFRSHTVQKAGNLVQPRQPKPELQNMRKHVRALVDKLVLGGKNWKYEAGALM